MHDKVWRLLMDSGYYIKVKLDEDGTILEFDSSFENLVYDERDVVGKNWFDVFIDESDKQKLKDVFKAIIEGDETKWKFYNNDIRCLDGSHKYMDFTNSVSIENGKKIVESIGVEHFENQF